MAQLLEGPPLADTGGARKGRLDPTATGKGDDDEVEEASEGVAEVTPAGLCLPAYPEVREEKAGEGAQERSPQWDNEGEVDAPDGQQGGRGRHENEAEDGEGDLLGEVSLGAAAEDGEVTPYPRPDE